MTLPDAAAVIARGRPFVLAVTGAGSRALADLQGTPGCSRVLIEAFMPYRPVPLDRFMGQPFPSHASKDAARAMAWSAWRKTIQAGATDAVGVSCCAALATNRERRGDDRAHFGWCDGLTCRSWTMVLDKSLGRAGQEALVSGALLALLADPDSPGLPPEDVREAPGPLAEVLEGKRLWARVEADGAIRSAPAPDLVVSGSFNPLHAGHAGLARAAEQLTGRKAVFEITAVNADKPPMATGELLRRIRQFHGVGPLVVTRLGTFAAKADALPGAVFVVGHDTATRILEERFYQQNSGGLAGALDHLRRLGSSFLVAGRATEDGVYHSFDESLLPDKARGLFKPIPEGVFRLDISSTDIRRRLAVGRGPGG